MKEVCIKVPTDVVRIVIELERESTPVVAPVEEVSAPVVTPVVEEKKPKATKKKEAPVAPVAAPTPAPVAEEPAVAPAPTAPAIEVEVPKVTPVKAKMELKAAKPFDPVASAISLEAECVMFDRREASHRNLFGALITHILKDAGWTRDPSKMEWAKSFLENVHLKRACVIPSQNRLSDDFVKDVKDALLPTA
jgi:hypothetical protein